MVIENLVGLFVTDDASYDEYRAGMKPILARFGGEFGYDFRVSDVLKSETAAPINRVFTIRFPDRGAMKAFFANEDYLAVKKQCFEPAVSHTTILAEYERPPASRD